MKFTLTTSGPPVGSYNSEFVGAEPYDENADKYGAGVLLKWKIIGGEQDGTDATRICSAKFTAKCNLAKFAAAIKGGPIEPGEEFDFASYVGTKGMIVVEETESGGTRVSTFLRQQ